jgi:hypothetical protein
MCLGDRARRLDGLTTCPSASEWSSSIHRASMGRCRSAIPSLAGFELLILSLLCLSLSFSLFSLSLPSIRSRTHTCTQNHHLYHLLVFVCPSLCPSHPYRSQSSLMSIVVVLVSHQHFHSDKSYLDHDRLETPNPKVHRGFNDFAQSVPVAEGAAAYRTPPTTCSTEASIPRRSSQFERERCENLSYAIRV